MTFPTRPEKIAKLVHEKSVDILKDVGFCVPDGKIISRFKKSGFPVFFRSSAISTKSENIELICRNKGQDIIKNDQENRLPTNNHTEVEKIMRKYIPDFHYKS